jgi:GNAT superfamily N-acetyltransferase
VAGFDQEISTIRRCEASGPALFAVDTENAHPSPHYSRVLPRAAHLHNDILESHQKQGWARKPIERAVEYLRGEGIDGVWLMMNPKNASACKFYER